MKRNKGWKHYVQRFAIHLSVKRRNDRERVPVWVCVSCPMRIYRFFTNSIHMRVIELHIFSGHRRYRIFDAKLKFLCIFKSPSLVSFSSSFFSAFDFKNDKYVQIDENVCKLNSLFGWMAHEWKSIRKHKFSVKSFPFFLKTEMFVIQTG